MMRAVTIHCDTVQVNEISQRQEYKGQVFDRALAIQGIIHGGQIMIDCNTFNGINTSLSGLAGELKQHAGPSRQRHASRPKRLDAR